MSTTVTLLESNLHSLDDIRSQEEHNEEEEEREAELIIFENCSKGLGIKICGGCSIDASEIYGIFVKRILPNGLADLDGHLQEGDQILEVNGESLEGVTNERAVAILRQASASGRAEIIVTRDEQAKEEFIEVIERHSITPQQRETSQQNSRSSTPSGYGTDSVGRSGETNHSHPPVGSFSQNLVFQNGAVDQRSKGHSESHLCNGAHSGGNFKLMGPTLASTPMAKKSTNDVPYLGVCSTISPVVHTSSSSLISGIHHLPATETTIFTSHSALPSYQDLTQARKNSLEPSERVALDKLEGGLRFVGLQPSEDKIQELRNRVTTDADGTVVYGDFVAVAKNVFKDELAKINLKHGVLFPVNEEGDFMEPSLLSASASSDESFQQNETDVLKQEIQRLKVLLHEKETYCLRADEEIKQMKKTSQGVLEETKSLKSKIQLAQEAQRHARSMERDYEEVVQMLEAEITKLKAQHAAKVHVETTASSQQKIAVLTCQLKKSEASRRAYEVATEKLLQFAENVHETMTGQGKSLAPKSQGEPSRGTKPPGYLAKHKRTSPKTLASEAKDVVTTVRNLLDAEPLPYGWDEAYTPDGLKYYINHLTQTTTWAHPKSGVLHMEPISEQKNMPNTL